MALLQDTTRTHQNAALKIISDALLSCPESRKLAFNHAELLSICGHTTDSLEACEAFFVRFGIDEKLLALALKLREKAGLHNRLIEAGAHSIALCMIVKNEEKNLPACLASLKPVVDEMIVVDTGSTDRTIDIATLFGAKVMSFPWNGNFSDARNFSLETAKSSWILVIDADEVLSPRDYEAIRRAVRKGVNYKAWSVLTRNYTTRVNAEGWTPNDHLYDKEERADGWHPSWKIRLFPNLPNIRFDGEVHEMVEKSLLEAGYTIKKATFVVHHYGGLSESSEETAEKGRKYFEIGMKKLNKNPNDIGALIELAVQAGEIGRFEEAIILWDRLLILSPDNVEGLFNKSYSLIKLEKYNEAIAISEQVLNLAPDHKEAAFNYGASSLYAGDPESAVQKLEPILKQNPEYPPLLAVMTLLYLISGKRENAVRTYLKLIDLNYAIADYARDRAAVLSRIGSEDRANQLLHECIAIGLLKR